MYIACMHNIYAEFRCWADVVALLQLDQVWVQGHGLDDPPASALRCPGGWTTVQ